MVSYRVVRGAAFILLLTVVFYVTEKFVWADPVADISFVSSLDCHNRSRHCGAILLGGDYAGSKLGVEINKNLGATIRVELKEGEGYPLLIAVGGAAGATVTLTWDGDYNSRQLSSIGLNCLDATSPNPLTVPIRFDDARHDSMAPQTEQNRFSARLIVYNGKDPTGQKYSIASALQKGDSIEFRKEAFTRNGPRGAVDFSCVGAVALVLEFDEPLETSLWLGRPREFQAVPVENRLVGNSPATVDKRAARGAGASNGPIESKTPVLRPDHIPQVGKSPLYVRDLEGDRPIDTEHPSPLNDSDAWDSAGEDVLVFGEAARTH
jgi:hypothetical protein